MKGGIEMKKRSLVKNLFKSSGFVATALMGIAFVLEIIADNKNQEWMKKELKEEILEELSSEEQK